MSHAHWLSDAPLDGSKFVLKDLSTHDPEKWEPVFG